MFTVGLASGVGVQYGPTPSLPKGSDSGETKIFLSEVQYPLSRWANHPAKAPAIDWEEGHPNSRGIEVFMDGSRTGSNVGSGVAIYTDGQLLEEGPFRLSSEATVYQAELAAIVKGLEMLNSCDIDASEDKVLLRQYVLTTSIEQFQLN